MKSCPKCKTCKPLSEFYKEKASLDGLSCWCKSCKRAYTAAYQKSHPETCRDYQRKYRADWTPEQRVKVAQAKIKYRKKVRVMIRERYGKVCQCCGEHRPEFLTLDHINGGGGRHRKAIGGGGVLMYVKLVGQGLPEGYQTLCFNCNAAKGAFGECPHKKELVKTA